jgi:hypothetical protein
VDAQDVARIKEPGERALAVNQLIDEYQAAITELSDLRRETLRELLAAGMPQMAIADLLGISKSRVSQLLSAGSRPERAFLGTGTVTVAVGGKLEAGKAEPGAVVSSESFGGYEVLASLARSVGLDVTYEVVPPPGHVHLNRANLIVMAGPRLLPFLDQVLEADVHLGFRHDEQGWYLVDKDTGTQYRSPISSGDPADYAYLGRLPRPDGKGTFLYLAGIHAPGNLGAAQYIADHLAELHRELKNRRFSALISCKFDPRDRKQILSTERVTPLYRHDGLCGAGHRQLRPRITAWPQRGRICRQHRRQHRRHFRWGDRANRNRMHPRCGMVCPQPGRRSRPPRQPHPSQSPSRRDPGHRCPASGHLRSHSPRHPFRRRGYPASPAESHALPAARRCHHRPRPGPRHPRPHR